MIGETQCLRVLMATPRYFPLMGGIETHVYEVSRRLAEAGVSVTVLTTDPGRRLPVGEPKQGVCIRRVPAWPAHGDWYLAPGVYQTIMNGDWDIVHSQGIHTFVPPLAMLAARNRRIPYVVTFHTGGHSSRFRNTIRGTQWQLLRPLLVRAERLIGVSKFEADFFCTRLHLPAEQFTVIPNGGRLPSFEGTPRLDPTRPVIVSVGRLERYKGHHRLIEALPYIQHHYAGARLRVVGSGPYEATLRQVARAHGVAAAVDIGPVAPSDRQGMAEILGGAAVVALLSEYEAHPVAVMEALALKRPVLVADTSGLHEFAERGMATAIALRSTPQEVAAAVVHQLAHPLIPAVVDLPTWEGCANTLLALYQEIIARP